MTRQSAVSSWSDEKKSNVKARYAEGWPCATLAKKMGVSERQLSKLLFGTESKLSQADKAGFARKKQYSASLRDAATCRFATKAHEIEAL